MSYTPKRLIAEAGRILPIDKYQDIFQQPILYSLMREAIKKVMLACDGPVARTEITVPESAVNVERTINLPDGTNNAPELLKFVTDGLRVKEPGDDALFEGEPITIVSHRELDRYFRYGGR